MLLESDPTSATQQDWSSDDTRALDCRAIVPDELQTGARDLKILLGRVESQALIEADADGPAPVPATIERAGEILGQTAYEMMRQHACGRPHWEFPLGAVTTDGEGAIRIEWSCGPRLNVVLVVGGPVTYLFSKVRVEDPGSIESWTPAGLANALHEICKARTVRG